ncbi:diacylglycerol kinase family protein [Blastococcus sp. URHD0036]|uniref:diacylglycerol/lipid kinase family protein n=1 Tax=Blastococcus sp. URHD0036 TaxID=1380356 RepID=UPI0004959EA3|nr:diacylglycerol kinase family protein [Blastococcus sp. URHD0036]
MTPSARDRWTARAALVLPVLVVVLLLVTAGRRGVWMVLLTAAVAVVVLAAGFWFLRERGALRLLALAVVVAAPLALLVLFATRHLLWVAIVAAVLLFAAVAAGRTALRPDPAEWTLPVREVTPAQRPFVIMNPLSGGGKVGRFDLQRRAEELGAEVALLDRPGTDVQQLARDALARGADLLGVAGGDGTQALVAQVAADADVPFVVISAGTRNHFALDLGLDREDPARGLVALRDGVEARVDLGEVNGRPFVNNASFGAYAEIVESPAYRDDKRGTTLDTLPDLLRGRRGAHLVADVGDGTPVEGPQALLVSNDPYEAADLAGLGRRSRLDRGVLGVVALRVDSARQAVALLGSRHERGLRRAETLEVVVTADRDEIPVGIDGETVQLSTPVRCTSRPGALRVRLPRDRPGIRPPRGRLDATALWALAVGRSPVRPSSAVPA